MLLIIAIVIVVIILAGVIGAYFLMSKQKVNYGGGTPVYINKSSDEVNENVVGYMLNSLGVSSLHNPPLSSDNPKINIAIDGQQFSAQIISGKLSVARGFIQNEDIEIDMTKDVALKIFRSENPSQETKAAFTSGNAKLLVFTSKSNLFLKGYLDIYNKIAA